MKKLIVQKMKVSLLFITEVAILAIITSIIVICNFMLDNTCILNYQKLYHSLLHSFKRSKFDIL